MSLIDTYKQKLEAQIHEHKAQLDLLKAKARRIAIQSKFVGEKDLAAADKHLEHLKARYKEMKGAGGSALADLKTGVKKAVADLKASTQKAAHHFNNHPSQKARKHPKRAAAKKAKQAAKIVKHSKPARAVKRSKAAKAVKSAVRAKKQKR